MYPDYYHLPSDLRDLTVTACRNDFYEHPLADELFTGRQ